MANIFLIFDLHSLIILGVKGAKYKDHKEGPAGAPIYPVPVTYPTELNKGDHILFLTEDSDPPLRPQFQSALVTGADKSVQIVSYSRSGIYEDDVEFGNLKILHRVEYTNCRYSAKKSVSRAKWRLESGEDHYHALFNNSHCFVTWAKTGNEYLLYDSVDCLMVEEGKKASLACTMSMFCEP